MSDKDIVKEGVKLAEEELREEEKQRIKSVVKATLELLRQKEEKRRTLDEEIKILKRDVDDLKEGRIDRIKERQDLDSKAKEVSVIIIKERIVKEYIPSPWYIPWVIELKPQYIPYTPFYCGGTTTIATLTTNAVGTGISNATVSCSSATDWSFTTNNSMAHMYTSGTYQLADGSIKYL